MKLSDDTKLYLRVALDYAEEKDGFHEALESAFDASELDDKQYDELLERWGKCASEITELLK